jgi:4-hydroxythreonine-4-phosphate dehydrogenase
MMMGNKKLFIALFTEHIPLREVAKNIKTKKLYHFLIDFYHSYPAKKIGVLALNPHAGDKGVIGDEEKKIQKAISKANKKIKKKIFFGPLVPDTAFTKKSLKDAKIFVAMYHDQALAPLKALYFDESINVSLNLPIIRTSVDHGTAYDIAYKNKNVNNKSYIKAVKLALILASFRYNPKTHLSH